ncbi:MAG: hypothetical protein ACI88A_000390 [Paraglaciecola sp.]|jgi:hypothetical protein
MQLAIHIEILASIEKVWAAISDIAHAEKMISRIMAIEVLEQPEHGLVGLKWKETRKMFGKEATEIMWITDAIENEFYCTRAESHGCVYISRLSLSSLGSNSQLTMSFAGEPQTWGAKILSFYMNFLIQSSIKKELTKDLSDIKHHVEQQSSAKVLT